MKHIITGEEFHVYRVPVTRGWKDKNGLYGLPCGLDWKNAERLPVDVESVRFLEPSEDETSTMLMVTETEAKALADHEDIGGQPRTAS